MATYNITLLGSPWAQRVVNDMAFDLNDERIAVGTAWLPQARAVRWNPNPDLLSPSAPISEMSVAYGINSFGHIVGGAGQNWPGQAFLYKSGVMQNLASVFTAEQSQAQDINNAGVIAGWAGRIGRPNAFRYDSKTPTAPVNLGVLPGHDQSYANAINDKGQVTGISRKSGSPQNPHAFLYDHGLIDLGPAVYPNDINDAGQVVGARAIDDTSHWTAYLCETSSGRPQFEDLGPLKLPGFVGSDARAINKQGDIVGHSFTDLGLGPTISGVGQMIRAWVRPAGGPMQDLNSLIPPGSGWLLHWASAINDHGLIAGTGTYLGGYRAYLLTPAPEPSGFSWPWPLKAVIDRLGLIFSGKS